MIYEYQPEDLTDITKDPTLWDDAECGGDSDDDGTTAISCAACTPSEFDSFFDMLDEEE